MLKIPPLSPQDTVGRTTRGVGSVLLPGYNSALLKNPAFAQDAVGRTTRGGVGSVLLPGDVVGIQRGSTKQPRRYQPTGRYRERGGLSGT